MRMIIRRTLLHSNNCSKSRFLWAGDLVGSARSYSQRSNDFWSIYSDSSVNFGFEGKIQKRVKNYFEYLFFAKF